MRLTAFTTLAMCLALVGSAVATDDVTYNLSDDLVQPAAFGSDQKSDADQKSDCDSCGSKGGKGGKGGCSCYLFGPDEAFEISSGDNRLGIKFGGWTQFGYHNKNSLALPTAGIANLDGFNANRNNVNLHQQYFYAERVADGSCGWDWGFRVDMLYGIDANNTQAFGNDPGTYDFQNGLDYGAYGWAFPQAYVEVANGDLNIKAGHFYTLIGYEVVTAPNNFFYSHAFTMNNSEPFTHTGVIGSYNVNDNVTAYGGWTLGWDTGFDQYGSGSSWLGGLSLALTDNATLTYMSTYGNFGWLAPNSDNSYSHSVVLDLALTDRLNYVFQSDMLSAGSSTTAATGPTSIAERDSVGINQYLFYTLNDCWKAGARVEWYKVDGVSANGATFGLNYKPHANMVFRPEVKHEWIPGLGTDQTVFGMDAILTY